MRDGSLRRLLGVAVMTGLTVTAGLRADSALGADQRLPITVTTVSDSGPGSLRSAIDRSNATAGHDTIAFAFEGAGPHTITPKTALPAITDPATIDGYTQAGAVRPSKTAPATLKIRIAAPQVAAGLEVLTDDSLITGLVINGNTGGNFHTYVRITGDRNRVTASHIGTDVAGNAELSKVNTYGIEIAGDDNQVGGTATERNVISNAGHGVFVSAGRANTITGNRLGTNASGTAELLSGAEGVKIEGADANTVRENLISGWSVGVHASGDDNVIEGNLIGTDITGTTAIANGEGIQIAGGKRNQIGGTDPGDGNVISGNDWFGIELSQSAVGSADDNVIQGNKIGVDVTGAAAIPNGGTIPDLGEGILICPGNDNVIGGSEAGAANVISANVGNGVYVCTQSSGNRILGNRIGTDQSGTVDLGNTESGIHLESDDTKVGDHKTAAGLNVITHNGEDGVEVEDGTDNAILRNAIFGNGGLGIDLGTDGRNVDDPAPDGDTGANDLQNAPSLTTAIRNPLTTSVTWTLDSVPSTEMRVEFYWSSACDPTGFGEGLLYLGSTDVTTNLIGRAAGTLVHGPLPAGSVVTATATPLATKGAPTSTSEFSECIVIS